MGSSSQAKNTFDVYSLQAEMPDAECDSAPSGVVVPMVQRMNNSSAKPHTEHNPLDNPPATVHLAPVADVQVEIEYSTTPVAFNQLEADWHRLFSINPNASIFNSWDWNRLWWEHYGEDGQLFILVARINGKVQGIAPLYAGLSRALKFKKARTLRFIGSGGDTSPDDLGPLCHPDHEQALATAFARYLLEQGPAVRLLLCDMPAESPFVQSIIALASECDWTTPAVRQDKRRVDKLPATVDEYHASLSRNARKQRKRRFQKLQDSGEVQFIPCTTPEQVEATFAKLAELHRMRHESKGEEGSFSTSAYNCFHRAVMRKALERSELRLMALEINGQTVGIEYAFQVNGQLALFQTGFDPAFSHLSPGHLMMMHMIETAISEGASQIDCLKGDYEYKATYAKQWKYTLTLDTFRKGLVGSAYHVARRLLAITDTNVDDDEVVSPAQQCQHDATHTKPAE